MPATRYVDPVPNATARNWGGAQGRAPGMSGTLPSSNIGADYLAQYGSPLYAPIGGNIVQVVRSRYTGTETDPNIRKQAVNENYGWGTSVIIQGDDGFYHRLSHQVPDGVMVKQGQRVEAGQQVGLVGQSGNTKGNGIAGGAPHLDWEKYKAPSGNFNGNDRQYVDPRLGDFDSSPQAYQAGKARTYAGENDARGGLNRANMPEAMRQWAGLIEEKADKYGIPPELLAGIVEYESGGKADAGHPTSGATGLGQVMPKGSGPNFNDRPTKQELLDPETNLEWSAKILAANYKRYNNNPQSAAAAYLGAVDAQGNPTTAQDANGTNGFKYVQEVMSRAEKYTPTGQTGPSARDTAAAAAAQERKMAESTRDIIKDYNTNRTALNAEVEKTKTAAEEAQKAYNKALADSATLQSKTTLNAEEQKQFSRLQLLIPNLEAASKAAATRASEAYKNYENNEAALSKNLEIIAGKALTDEEKAQYAANTLNAQKQADLYAAQAKQYEKGSPEYERNMAQANLYQAQADQYKRTVDIDQQRANTQQYGAETDRFNAGTNRLKAETDIWATRETTPSIIARNLAAAGVDEVTATRLAARIAPELADLAADTRLKGDQAAYQRAITEKTNKLVGAELENLVQAGRLTRAQADKAVATLPAEIAAAEQAVRQGQATTGLTQAQTWAQIVEANTKQFEAEMKAREAETWQQVQKIAANPNSTDEDIIGAIQAGSRNATEAAQVYQTRINQYQQQEASRHNKVTEGLSAQELDQTARRQGFQSMAELQNARANLQNASTSAIGPRLGATGMANALAGLAGVVGSDQISRLAVQSGAGADVANPAIEGAKKYEADVQNARSGIIPADQVRRADLGATATEFKAPRATGATAGIGSSAIPTLNKVNPPSTEQVSFKNPTGATAKDVNLDATADAKAAGPVMENLASAAPTAPSTDVAAAPPPEPAPAPPPPPEEEEETGGGGKRGKGVKVVYSFKPPKAGKAPTKSMAIAAKKPPKGRLGGGGGFRVPGRMA